MCKTNVETKMCSKCGGEKGVDLFEKGRRQCKVCRSEYDKNRSRGCRNEYYKTRYRKREQHYKDLSRIFYRRSIEIHRERWKTKTQSLDETYIKYCIRVHVKDKSYNPTQEMIETYRQVLLLKREQKQLTNLIKTLKNGSNINL